MNGAVDCPKVTLYFKVFSVIVPPIGNQGRSTAVPFFRDSPCKLRPRKGPFFYWELTSIFKLSVLIYRNATSSDVVPAWVFHHQ